jgi:hypothetical protein
LYRIFPELGVERDRTDASLLNFAISNKKYRAMGFMLLCDNFEREYGDEVKDWKTFCEDCLKKVHLKIL